MLLLLWLRYNGRAAMFFLLCPCCLVFAAMFFLLWSRCYVFPDLCLLLYYPCCDAFAARRLCVAWASTVFSWKVYELRIAALMLGV